MSRLDEIRDAINGCNCVHCEGMVHNLGARELLAVVDLVLLNSTPEQVANDYRESAAWMAEDWPGVAAEDNRAAAIWDALS